MLARTDCKRHRYAALLFQSYTTYCTVDAKTRENIIESPFEMPNNMPKMKPASQSLSLSRSTCDLAADSKVNRRELVLLFRQ